MEQVHAALRRATVASRNVQLAREAYRESPSDQHADWLLEAWCELRAAVDALIALGGPIPGARLAESPPEAT